MLPPERLVPPLLGTHGYFYVYIYVHLTTLAGTSGDSGLLHKKLSSHLIPDTDPMFYLEFDNPQLGKNFDGLMDENPFYWDSNKTLHVHTPIVSTVFVATMLSRTGFFLITNLCQSSQEWVRETCIISKVFEYGTYGTVG